MEKISHSLAPYIRVRKSSPSPGQQHSCGDSTPPEKSNRRCNLNIRFPSKFTLLVAGPLFLHLAGSLILALTLTFRLDGRHFHLERHQHVLLVDGTSVPVTTKRHVILQSDMTTIISGSLVLLRWVGTIWAGPLCGRAVMLLAKRGELKRRDITWASRYRILHPKTYFQRPLRLHLMPGIISFLTLATFSLSPLLTGAVAWVPNSSIVNLVSWPTINITGTGPGSATAFDDANTAAIPTSLVSILTTAWSTKSEENVFKRVVSSAGRLNINSTIQDVIMPYLSVTNITWLPSPTDDFIKQFESMRNNKTEFPHLDAQMSQSGAIALLTGNATSRANSTQGTYQQSSILLLNVVGSYREYRKSQSCEPNSTILGNNPQVQYLNGNNTWQLPGCIALANVSFIVGAGVCETCRVTSNFTVQNATELKMLDHAYDSVTHALNDMPQYAPSLAPLLASFPDPRNNIDGYVKAFLVRSYSALWNAWTDAADPMSEVRESPLPSSSSSTSSSGSSAFQVISTNRMSSAAIKRVVARQAGTQSATPTLQSKYQPAFPTLQADVDATRVYAWLGVQLALTIVGLVALWMQTHLSDAEPEPVQGTKYESEDTLVPELIKEAVNLVSSQ